MPQTVRGRVVRNDNIAIALPCGTENAVASSVPAPTPQIENVQLGNTTAPYGVEKIQVGITGPNPEIP
jgi:hypothetical protein